ncbi:hypothetical protein CTA2_11811 [Colletotrichum tanaceti]|uniref:Uncharacterized protein n=1 Tax=Colletotrichum tanaceti TaxID=1306861 RepID=A0A4U6XQ91_9PEZI|nr:hypothetical protein CTA2_11811 [Colletotrichum tanaceti]TKW57941.1 hypothetical protein CTA1_3061 [Colletotrichum tanaceti]
MLSWPSIMSGTHRDPKPKGYKPARAYEVDSESPSLHPTKYKRYSIFSGAEWLLEILTSILSLILLAAIAYIFWRVDGEPLSAWTLPISLNALISVMTTACSAALMHGVSEFISQLKWLQFKNERERLENFQKFDEASRGPWGSLKFLASVKWNLATIGAFVTIARLSFAPLAQQVVKIDERFAITKDDSVTFGYAHMYERGIGRILANAGVGGIPQDPSMQAAILQGLYNISSPATFSCPGACIWHGSYVSLGFKSECKNVTQETLRSEDCFKNTNDVVTYCNMTTPGGVGISTRRVTTDSGTSFRMNVSAMTGSSGAAQTILSDSFPEIVRFAIYRSTSDHNFQPFDVNITECSLSLAAHKYSKANANGTAFSFENTQIVDVGGRDSWQWEGSLSSHPIFTNESKVDGIPALAISWHDLRAVQNFFESDTFVTEWVDGNYENKYIGLSAALAGDVDIEKRFEKMAVSMTDYVRSGPNSEFAYGEKMESEPFVSIRWYFMIGPVAIELTALLFATFTIIKNRKSRQVPLWKSSALAVLACEHEKKSGTIKTKAKDIKQIEKSAKETLVWLD